MNKKTFLPLITGLLLCFIAGCKDSATPEKPVVVKQSINQTATTTTEPETKAPATATQAEPQETQQVTPGQKKAADTTAPTNAPAEASKETAASDDAPAAPAAKEKTVSETPVAQAGKETPPAAEPPAQKVKKPAEPASDITPAEPPAATDAAMAPKPETAPTAETEKGVEPVATETASASLKSSLMEDDTTPPYDPTGKTDPFAALFSDKDEGGASGDSESKRALTPLEKIDISQLKLVAVILAESGNRAMVEDGSGKPFILTTGTYIGINSGSVSKILKDRVVIVEKSKDILGRETTSTRELKLQKPLGED
jgi:type IV pilus assembly protein PilP